MLQTVSEAIRELHSRSILLCKKAHPLSWGTKEQCRDILADIFCYTDRTIEQFEYLPEYDEVVDWMADTKGKGLLLMGSCGRGKSLIVNCIIPVLMKMQGKVTHPVHAQDFYRQPQFSTGNWACPSCLEYLLNTGIPIIDELGVEGMRNDYGEKCEGFNLIVNKCELTYKPLFISTNLTDEEIYIRYGERTLDRLSHLCRIVKFSGASLRQ